LRTIKHAIYLFIYCVFADIIRRACSGVIHSLDFVQLQRNFEILRSQFSILVGYLERLSASGNNYFGLKKKAKRAQMEYIRQKENQRSKQVKASDQHVKIKRQDNIKRRYDTEKDK